MFSCFGLWSFVELCVESAKGRGRPENLEEGRQFIVMVRMLPWCAVAGEEKVSKLIVLVMMVDVFGFYAFFILVRIGCP